MGFEPSATTDDLIARQQSLWKVWLDGFVCLPINLPGLGKACLLINDAAHKLPI